MTSRLVIFDVDGTLVDSQTDIIDSMTAAFAGQGMTVPSHEAIKGIVGLSLPVAVTHLAPRVSEARRDALVAAYKSTYQALRLQNGAKGSPLFPGARAALERLAANPAVTLAIATGKSRRGLEALMTSHDLAGFFASTQVADDHPSKPHPSMIHACLRETGIAAENAVIVGDTEFDIEMGHAAGIRAIGVTWGYHPLARLRRADLRIDAFDQLEAALGGLWA
ncbi:HAD-IA family hydrolase [Pararhodobacter aggregans]|uniref:HAD family hydrolase n=1 Tax=Pararhodobacter aggregans TaxID=404875 RepID=A0A2T7URT7_9RHOB|nr:HAD-IA family hydrolase [Pararhodobacter aggregans]PTX00311.1 phosphoglycolate phosphatase [Pararhodobacter aggregans]PVE47298.1 HAD family hydrolase [Pararhodobacter aggregans]